MYVCVCVRVCVCVIIYIYIYILLHGNLFCYKNAQIYIYEVLVKYSSSGNNFILFLIWFFIDLFGGSGWEKTWKSMCDELL